MIGAMRAAASASAAALAAASAAAQGSASKSFKLEGEVGSIAAWIDNKQEATTPTGLVDWQNANTTSSQSDSVAIFRLVCSVDVTLQATTADILVHTTVLQPLATYYRITSDGNGLTATGSKSTQNGDGVGGFLYVGGGVRNGKRSTIPRRRS